MPDLFKHQTRGYGLKSVIKEILKREEINRIFKFFATLSENSLTAQIFVNESSYLEGHVMTPGFLGFLSMVTDDDAGNEEDNYGYYQN